MKKIHISTEDFSRMAQELCSKIVPIRHKFEFVVGIERGGLPLSTWLAYILHKKHTSVKVSLYGDNDTKGEPVVDLKNLPRTPFLLVDDIVDSGTTIRLIEIGGKILRGRDFYFATLHWCAENSPDCKPDFYVQTKDKNTWVIYPWEKNNETSS